MRSRYILLVFVVILCSCFVLGDDFRITVKLDDEIYTGLEYDKLYTIKNLNWRTNKIESDVSINYYFLDEEGYILVDEFGEPVLDEEIDIFGLRSSKTSKTGMLSLDADGDYYFCAEIIETSLDDPNDENNLDCKDITFINFDDVDIYNDFEIEVILENMIFSELEYYDLFKVMNNDWSDFKIETNVTISYYIFDKENNIIFEDNTYVENLKASKSSKTGLLYIDEPGNFTFCAEIIETSLEDDEEENKLHCKEIFVVDSSTIPCNMSIEVDAKDFYYSDESVKFDFIINEVDYYPDVEYWVEDVFDYIAQEKEECDDDYDGLLYKSNIGEVYDYQNFLINVNITNPWCNDLNLEDNFAKKLIVVKNPTYYTFKEYEIDPFIILDVKDEGTFNFGDKIYVEINETWSGDMSGKLKIWVEENSTGKKASESTISLGMSKMTFIENLKIPVELKSNCDRKLKDGNYSVVVEGFGFKDDINVDIGGVNTNTCKRSSKQESSLNIDKISYKSGGSAGLGEIIRARVKVYKGNTGKSSLKAYVIDDGGKKISAYDSKVLLKTKFQKYDLTIPILLKPLCDEETEDKTYSFVVEGLDLKDQQEINIIGIDAKLCKYYYEQEKEAKKKSRAKSFDSRIKHIPPKVKQGEMFYVQVELENNKGKDLEIGVWSYIAKGRKAFTEKEANKKVVVVDDDEIELVKLVGFMPEDIESGEYDIKVGISRSDIKSNKYLTQSMIVEAVEKNNTCVVYQGFISGEEDKIEDAVDRIITEVAQTDKYSYKYDKDIEGVKPISGSVIYESSTVKASKFVPYIIMLMLFVLCIVLVIWKV